MLAAAGFRVFGVDRSLDNLREARSEARAAGRCLNAWCADLTAYPLAEKAFDVVLVTRYLQRGLFPAIRQTVVPGGVVIYETFTRYQQRLGWGPTSADHLLEPGELVSYFHDFDILFYEECAEPEAVARLVARRRS